MIRCGNKVRLTEVEKTTIECFVGEKINPETVEDHNAWVEQMKDDKDNSPESKLLNAVADLMKIK